MKKLPLFSLLLLTAILCSLAFIPAPPGNYRKVTNNTFQRGEWMKFRVHYGFITAGYATTFVEQQTDYRSGRKCYHIVGEGISAPSYDWIFKVRDRYETWMDEESLFAWQFNRKVAEGDFYSYTESRFDQGAQKAFYTDERKQVTTYDVPENIQDPVSAFFHARSQYSPYYMQPGDKLNMRQFIDRKTVNLEAQMIKREVIEVSGHSYKALKFKLLIEESGLITDDADIFFWISEDDNKIPLRIEMNLYFGALRVDMMAFSGLRHPLTSQIK